MPDEKRVSFRDFGRAITQCSPEDAWNAENQFCSSPAAQKALVVACAGSVAATVYGGYMVKVGGEVTLYTGGEAAPLAIPAAAVGAAMAVGGGFAVKRYCVDLVTKGIDAVTQNQVHYESLRPED